MRFNTLKSPTALVRKPTWYTYMSANNQNRQLSPVPIPTNFPRLALPTFTPPPYCEGLLFIRCQCHSGVTTLDHCETGEPIHKTPHFIFQVCVMLSMEWQLVWRPARLEPCNYHVIVVASGPVLAGLCLTCTFWTDCTSRHCQSVFTLSHNTLFHSCRLKANLPTLPFPCIIISANQGMPATEGYGFAITHW